MSDVPSQKIDECHYQGMSEAKILDLHDSEQITSEQREKSADELRRRAELGRVPTTCIEHAYGTTTRPVVPDQSVLKDLRSSIIREVDAGTHRSNQPTEIVEG